MNVNVYPGTGEMYSIIIFLFALLQQQASLCGGTADPWQLDLGGKCGVMGNDLLSFYYHEQQTQ